MRRIADLLGEDYEFLMGHTDSASKGLGQVVGTILEKATPDELDLLQSLPDDLFHEMMGEFALKYAKALRAYTVATPPPTQKK